MPTAATLTRHYEGLTAAERFVACVEAMARGDADEEQRLDDGCPRGTYEADDPAYRRRISVSFTSAALVCASVTRDLDVLRALGVVRDVARVFRDVPAEAVEDAFWAGWHAGRQGGGTGDEADQGQDEAGDATDPPLGPVMAGELRRLRKRAGTAVRVVATAPARTIGLARAVSLLSAWAGLTRFCRECVGVEPLTLTKAWRLLADDPVAEVRLMYPKAEADERLAASWYESLAGGWRKHADPGGG